MSKDPFQCVRQKVPVRTSWTHGYLDLSGPTVQSRPNQAPSAGCPGWCNLPTATLVAHFASWSRTLAALRPKALPFPPHSLSSPLSLLPLCFGGVSALRFRSFRSLKPILPFPFRFAFDIPLRRSSLDDVVAHRTNPATRRPTIAFLCRRPVRPLATWKKDPRGRPPSIPRPDARLVMTRERELPTPRR
jgi:hypothetical protein